MQTLQLLSKTARRIQQAVPLCAALLLLGCATQPNKPTVEPQPKEQVQYRFSVQPQSAHAAFQEAMEVELKRDLTVLGTMHEDAAQLQISAMPRVQADPLTSTSTPSFGKLAAKQTTFEIRIPYTLRTFAGQTLHTGEIRYMTEPLQVISPTLTMAPKIEMETWQDIASMLLADALPHISGTPWQAHVIGLADKDHGILNVGEGTSIPVRATLVSNSTPATTAEIVVYEKNSRGTSRGIVKHISGPPLLPGMAFSPIEMQK